MRVVDLLGRGRDRELPGRAVEDYGRAGDDAQRRIVQSDNGGDLE